MIDQAPAITITEKARQRLLDAGLDQAYLRIKVISGGCSGYTFDATIDPNREENDVLIYGEGVIRVITDPKSSLFLNGLDIDYSDDLIQSGFRLTNAKAGQSCGCGASFSM